MEDELRILMLEDQEQDAGLIERTLRAEKIRFTSMRVDTRTEFINAFSSFMPDVVLSDHALPQFNSIEALKISKEKNENIPFILVTGAVSEEFAVACLKKGANDYVLKSNLSRLPIAVLNSIRQCQYESQRKQNEDILVQQNKELKKLNKDLDLFVYSTSHNLRAPLTSVLGLINISEDNIQRGLTDELPRYLSMMKDCVGRLTDSLKRIADYSQNMKLAGQVEKIDFQQTIQFIYDDLVYVNENHTIEKTIVLHPGPPVYLERVRLELILQNLISNAFKYADLSRKNSYIKVEVFSDHEQVKITVEDNGTGIPQEHQSRIFEMFYRASVQSEGSGLGLFIVKEMVDNLGGQIDLISSREKGTSIFLTLPNHVNNNFDGAS